MRAISCSRDTLLPTSLPLVLTLLETPLAPCTLPDIYDDILDTPSVPQKPVHGGDGPTASDLPPVPPTVPILPPPSPPVRSQTPPSTYHSLPPVPSPSPAPAPAPPPAAPSCPQHLRRPRDRWMPEQWIVPDRYKQPRVLR
jgi:hypothetical protein